MNLAPKLSQWILFGVCVLVQAGIWIASPYLTNHREPWDSQSYYYWGGLFLCGLVAGFLMPRFFWFSALGIWGGQMAGFLTVFVTHLASNDGHGDSMAVPGFFLALPMFSLLGLIGAAIGAIAGMLFQRSMRSFRSNAA